MRCRHGFRRLLLVALVAGAVAWWWQRSRSRAEADSSPDLSPTSFGAAMAPEPAPTPNPVAADEVGVAPAPEPAPAPNPVADQEAEAEVAVARWELPVDSECPPGYPVKANDNSGIYHLPGGRSYERTVAERCYATAEAAEADGYRQSKT